MTVGRHLGNKRGGTAAKRAVLGFAVVLAFLLQSFVTATHVHNPATAGSVAASAHFAAKQPGHQRAPVEPASNCPICHAVAQSGNFLTPAPIVFALAPSAAIWLYSATFGNSALSRRSHAWQSRAPPA
ncbi:MAG: hypothetical protein P0Y56_08500 [Candidatus Andeanibacterium colombiense]|uniref:DUF2946 domain-containing protein n=1 Tax=Candidatus Andeanibacterium colombiense TaxID=3121345 RepID=A0AAJ5XBA7_9SPHN|nr:MAG: hypothetical protein P0Y56_08500 [Sphingomonadaceae bacterium]